MLVYISYQSSTRKRYAKHISFSGLIFKGFTYFNFNSIWVYVNLIELLEGKGGQMI